MIIFCFLTIKSKLKGLKKTMIAFFTHPSSNLHSTIFELGLDVLKSYHYYTTREGSLYVKQPKI